MYVLPYVCYLMYVTLCMLPYVCYLMYVTFPSTRLFEIFFHTYLESIA